MTAGYREPPENNAASTVQPAEKLKKQAGQGQIKITPDATAEKKIPATAPMEGNMLPKTAFIGQ